MDHAPQEGGRKLLDPSELGTKEYWEAAYAREIHNNGEDGEDEGVIWFDESSAEDTVLKKLAEYAEYQHPSLLSRRHCRFLDLGTGNGHMLFALREDEDDDGVRWTGEMVGVDYSPQSIRLARQLDAQRRAALENDEYGDIRFEEWNILSSPPGDWLAEKFDIVLDKGTFDAISLMPYDGQSTHPCEIYRAKVAQLVKPSRFLFITSCNWTRDELIDWLAPAGGEFTFHDEAEYPTFTFGGQTGQSVVTAVFRKNGAS